MAGLRTLLEIIIKPPPLFSASLISIALTWSGCLAMALPVKDEVPSLHIMWSDPLIKRPDVIIPDSTALTLGRCYARSQRAAMQLRCPVDRAAITDRQENGVSVTCKVWTFAADRSPLQGFDPLQQPSEQHLYDHVQVSSYQTRD